MSAVVKEKEGSRKVRRVHDLSYPRGASVNAAIETSKRKYASIDDAAEMIRRLGRGAQLAKIDIKSAFRCIAVFPGDRWCLGLIWDGKFYADLTLPFGLRSSPMIWEDYATAIQWIMSDNGVFNVVRYVDDFLFGGPADSKQCESDITRAVTLLESLGAPIAMDKFASEGTPSTQIVFLGIQFDTIAMQMRLHPERIRELIALLTKWKAKRSCERRQLQSLIGKLVFAAKVVRAGRTFIARMLCTLRTVDDAKDGPHAKIELDSEFHADVRWWITFLESWNGISVIPSEYWSSSAHEQRDGDASELELFTDACQTGFGAVCGKQYTRDFWSDATLSEAKRDTSLSMPYLELLAIAVAVATWAPQLGGRKITIRSDCKPAVQALQDFTCHNQQLLRLVRIVLLITAKHQLALRVRHIGGKLNAQADALSRFRRDLPIDGQVRTFETAHPTLTSGGVPAGTLPTPDW
jgi:hypothetical protein